MTNLIRVMVVEDNALLGRAICRALDGAEFEVEVFDTLADACDALVDGRALDVVLCDMHIGTATGEHVYQFAVSARPELRDRFVFMSGGVKTAALQAFWDAQPRRLDKPFTRPELRTALRATVGAL